MKKPAIPLIPNDPKRNEFDKSIKECIESIMGRRGNKIAALPANATLNDVINKVNEIVDAIQ